MEAERRRRVLSRKTKPLSDCTNTCHSSSSSVPLNPSFKKHSTNLHIPPNPSSPPPPSPHGTIDLEASEPISIVYSRRRSSNKRKAVALPVSSTPILKISNSREKSDGLESANIPKAKAFTVPCRKKRHAVSSEQDVLKDPLLQDFIEKQKAYFKAIDEFKLPEEEVESIDELD